MMVHLRLIFQHMCWFRLKSHFFIWWYTSASFFYPVRWFSLKKTTNFHKMSTKIIIWGTKKKVIAKCNAFCDFLPMMVHLRLIFQHMRWLRLKCDKFDILNNFLFFFFYFTQNDEFLDNLLLKFGNDGRSVPLRAIFPITDKIKTAATRLTEIHILTQRSDTLLIVSTLNYTN